MWACLKHEFFKLSFSRNRLIAWVEPLSSGCSPFYFTVAWWMLNFWGSFLNVPYNFQWSLQRSYWAAPTMPGFAVQDTHGQSLMVAVFCPCLFPPGMLHFCNIISRQRGKTFEDHRLDSRKTEKTSQEGWLGTVCQEVLVSAGGLY